MRADPIDHARLRELAQRLVASGPKACAVSASECHEISEGLIAALDEIELLRTSVDRCLQNTVAVLYKRDNGMIFCEKHITETADASGTCCEHLTVVDYKQIESLGIRCIMCAQARGDGEGLAAAKALEAGLIDRICFQIGQTHDTSELWGHMRRDPEAFRAAVRIAMKK